MKATVKMLALLIVAGFLASGCAAVSRINAEYEEEMVRVEKMTPEEKAEWNKQGNEKINWNEYSDGSD